MRNTFPLLLVCLPLFFCGCEDDAGTSGGTRTFTFDFTTGLEGWTGGFADHPDTTTSDYNLVFARTALPAPLDTAKQALKIAGTNGSDDLFMFIKRKIDGLQPNRRYDIKFEVEIASNVPTNQVGVGGAPDAVWIKVGAVRHEPLSVKDNSDGHFKMNLNKGYQSTDGPDMYNIGTVGVADNITQYTLISRNNSSRLFSITASASGEVWVIIGTDSGFEARTELYYNNVRLTFTP